MSRVILPYYFQDGQKAYAAKLMADLNAIVDKINNISLPGLADTDLETALQQLKLQLDQEYTADAKVVESFAYDGAAKQLVIALRDGALFAVDMSDFYNDYSGVDGQQLEITVNGARQISGALKDNSVNYAQLSAGLRSLLDSKVTADAAGNADSIKFNDGETMQEKLDSNALRGADGVTAALDSIYYFRVGADGHLYIGVADGAEPPPFSISEEGDLIYTIE